MIPLKDWDDLPDFMRTGAVRPYYDNLKNHERELFLKRAFDVVAAMALLVLLAPIMVVVSVWIKLDSHGPVFFRQTRVTQYGKEFRIFKFRTMVEHAEVIGPVLTIGDDARITRVGTFIRKYRIDEFPQLFNVLAGDMSFVGTRPEVTKYIAAYTDEMYATLLLPAGITSEASIQFRDEEQALYVADDPDAFYINQILPRKMELNLKELCSFSWLSELNVLLRTVIAVLN